MRPSEPQQRSRSWTLLVPVAIALALVGYKAIGATARLRSGIPPAAHGGDAVQRTILYFAAIWPALAFGLLIAAAVRAFVPAALLERLFARRARSQAIAAAVATPLMLCACCAAPLFTGVYERTRKPAPALALALGAPSLNIAALAFTFILLGPALGATRIVVSVALVSGGVLFAARLAATGAPETLAVPAVATHDPSVGGFARALAHVAVRTVPLIVVGVLLSSLLATRISTGAVAAMRGSPVLVPALAALALPLALPTFFELPLALTLLAAGLPAGAAMAVLIAGPATNLPSLMTIARAASWRLAAAAALVVWLAAVAGGGIVAALP